MGTDLQLGPQKCFGNRWLWWHSMMSVVNVTELYTRKWLKWHILWYVFYRNFKNE